MRTNAIVIAALLLAALEARAANEPRGRAGRATPRLPAVQCPQRAPQPGGVCAPYDREHCRFVDGTLLRFDPRDANAPYTLQPVSGQPGIYCRYDAGLKPAGVVAVLDPVEQKRQNDARKRRRL